MESDPNVNCAVAPECLTTVVPDSGTPPGPPTRLIVTVPENDVRSVVVEYTPTLIGVPVGVLSKVVEMLFPTSVPLGSLMNLTVQEPETWPPTVLAVVRTMKFPGGPLNWFDCLAVVVQVYVPVPHGAVAGIVTVFVLPGVMSSVLKTTVVVVAVQVEPAGPVTPAVVMEKPAGVADALTLIDPSFCCGALSVKENVNAVFVPAFTDAGVTVTR